MISFFRILEESEIRRESLVNKGLICFCSNDYLGLAKNKNILKVAISDIKKNGVGSGGSKFISGFSLNYQLVTEKMKIIKQAEDCLIFTSGYTCNIGIFESLTSSEDIIFLDEECHASTFAGIMQSGVKFMRFNHNDIQSLKEKINKYSKGKRRIFIATETVFSMSGDLLLNHNEYIEVARQHQAILITDEAHSFGVINIEFAKYEYHLKMGTFSKAVGVLGGYVCGNKNVIEHIRQFAKSGIYTTALPSHVLASVLASLNLIESGKVNGKKALMNAKIFQPSLQTQIAFVKCSGSVEALELEEVLKQEGFFVKAIRKPTVKQAGVRITFNNFHKKVDIQKLRFTIDKFLKR